MQCQVGDGAARVGGLGIFGLGSWAVEFQALRVQAIQAFGSQRWGIWVKWIFGVWSLRLGLAPLSPKFHTLLYSRRPLPR